MYNTKCQWFVRVNARHAGPCCYYDRLSAVAGLYPNRPCAVEARPEFCKGDHELVTVDTEYPEGATGPDPRGGFVHRGERR